MCEKYKENIRTWIPTQKLGPYLYLWTSGKVLQWYLSKTFWKFACLWVTQPDCRGVPLTSLQAFYGPRQIQYTNLHASVVHYHVIELNGWVEFGDVTTAVEEQPISQFPVSTQPHYSVREPHHSVREPHHSVWEPHHRYMYALKWWLVHS